MNLLYMQAMPALHLVAGIFGYISYRPFLRV
jgi:hypothetical protein